MLFWANSMTARSHTMSGASCTSLSLSLLLSLSIRGVSSHAQRKSERPRFRSPQLSILGVRVSGKVCFRDLDSIILNKDF